MDFEAIYELLSAAVKLEIIFSPVDQSSSWMIYMVKNLKPVSLIAVCLTFIPFVNMEEKFTTGVRKKTMQMKKHNRKL